jgi:hypothetical protein
MGKSLIHKLIDDVREYIKAQQRLLTLKIAEKSSKLIAELVSGILLGSLVLVTFLFASIALGFLLSGWFHSHTLGFGCMACLYLLIFILLLMNRKRWLITPIMNAIIKSFFSN